MFRQQDVRPGVEPSAYLPIFGASALSNIGEGILRLLRLWKLSKADQLRVLGFSHRSYATLSRLSNGAPFPTDPEKLERASHLLGIHAALKTLYPENPEMVSGWMTFRNSAFGDNSPLDVVKDKGTVGLLMIRLYLEHRLHN